MLAWPVPACWSNLASRERKNMSPDHVAVLNHAVDRCCSVLRQEPLVEAVYLVGSLARGDADAHSDVDLCIVVAPGCSEAVLARAEAIAAQVGPALAGARLPGSSCYAMLYDFSGCVIKIDYDYFGLDQLPVLITKSLNSRTYLVDRRLLFDRHGGAESAFAAAAIQPVSERFHPEAWFPISAWSVIRMVGRGELLEAVDILNHMRDPLITRLLSRAFDVPFENYRRMEKKLPDAIMDCLRRTFPWPARDELLCSLGELVNLYLHVCESLSEEVGPRERSTFTRILDEVQRQLQPCSAALGSHGLARPTRISREEVCHEAPKTSQSEAPPKPAIGLNRCAVGGYGVAQETRL